MSDKYKKSHLRLISAVPEITQAAETIKSEVPEHNPQSSFNFRMEWNFVFVREADILKNVSFVTLLENFKPGFLFDVRLAPRLDFFASNRITAFRTFNEFEVDYVDILGASGIDTHRNGNSMPEVWIKFLESKFRNVDAINKNSIFIFDNDDVLNRSRYVLPSFLSGLKEFSNTNIEVLSGAPENLIAM